VVPEKQGLKPIISRMDKKRESSLSSGSRKTRIETWPGAEEGICLYQSKQWFQKNKD